MRVESGPAKADRNWQLLRAVLFLGFAAWFVYDGAVRWPEQNRKAAETALQGRPWDGKLKYENLPETPTATDYEKVQHSKPATRQEVIAALGPPAHTEGNDSLFVSKYGYGRVAFRGDTVAGFDTWRKWEGGRTKEEIQSQFYWAIIPAVIAIPFLWKLYKAATLRVTVNDDGVTYGGKRIAFADVTSLRDYSPKGWIDLYYMDGGVERRQRLDNEKIALFDEVVEGICQAKGFPNEVKEYAEQKAREEAESAADLAAAESETAEEEAENKRNV